MTSIRPKRIVEGFTKAVLCKNTDSSQERMAVCNTCEFREGIACGVCGCVLTAKTKVAQEACPKNLWDDIKKIPYTGIAIRLHEQDKAILSVDEGILTIRYKEPYKYQENPQNTAITIDIVNLRSDEENISKDNVKLTNLYLSHCSCFESRINGKDVTQKSKAIPYLDDGQHITVKFKYNTNLDPAKMFNRNKDIKIMTDQGTIIFKFAEPNQ